MTSNAQKYPLGLALNQFAQRKIAVAFETLGRSLPCHVIARAGQIVTVAFDVIDTPLTLPNIRIPILTSIYDWLPIEAGQKGFTVPADTYLGGVSGLGGGTATFALQGNLTPLVFVPVANASWEPPGGDPDMRVVQGPDGVLITDTSGAVVGQFSKTTGVTLSFAGHSITITSEGVSIDGVPFLPHAHSGVQSGGADTGPVVT